MATVISGALLWTQTAEESIRAYTPNGASLWFNERTHEAAIIARSRYVWQGQARDTAEVEAHAARLGIT